MNNRKKKSKKSCRANLLKSSEVSKTYFDNFSITARKMLQLIDIDPAIFDLFTKKQKLLMMRIKFEIPKIIARKGDLIPRHYIKFIQHETYEFLIKGHMGNTELNLSYMDYITMGIAFIGSIGAMERDKINPELDEHVKEIVRRYEEHEKNRKSSISEYLNSLMMLTAHITKLNFRIYGFLWDGWISSDVNFSMICPIYITSTNAQSINFDYHNTTHKAHRLGAGTLWVDKPVWVKIPYNQIITESSNERLLHVFIQSHAVVRMKERMDALQFQYQFLYLINVFHKCKPVQAINGSIVLAVHDYKDNLLGYMPFTIQGDKLILLSFLPLSSPGVPEGNKFCKSLKITKEDMKFLGMDKLSFYLETDFNAVPHLKEKMIEAGLWHLTEITHDWEIEQEQVQKNTAMITKFFQQSSVEINREEVFDEIEKRY